MSLENQIKDILNDFEHTSSEKILEILNQIKPQFKCPLCDWTTKDLNNSSDWFTQHIKTKHSLTPNDIVQLYPNLKKMWKLYFLRKERQDFINTTNDNRIQCLQCKQEGTENYFKKISNSHLLHKHNMTVTEYKNKFNTITTSKYLSLLQSELTTHLN